MSSRFQIVKWLYNKKSKYAIHEVFTDHDEVIGINNKPLTIEGETLESLHNLMDRIYNDMNEYGIYSEDGSIDTIEKQYLDSDTEEGTEDLVDIFKRFER